MDDWDEPASSRARRVSEPVVPGSRPFVNDSDSAWVEDPRYPGKYRRRKDLGPILGPVLGRVPDRWLYAGVGLLFLGLLVFLVILGVTHGS